MTTPAGGADDGRRGGPGTGRAGFGSDAGSGTGPAGFGGADAADEVHAQIEQAPPEVEQHPAGARSPVQSDFSRFPTGPVGVGPIVTSGPDTGPTRQWEPGVSEPQPDDAEPKLAPWALLAASVALVASFFVGWGIPVAIVSVVAAIMCLRRPVESRAMARWALVLGIVATVYSTGWLIWAASQFDPNAVGAMG